MFQKILVALCFLGAQFTIAWYGYHTGKLTAHGSFLGFRYDSAIVGAIVTQIKFLWVIIGINVLFSLGFRWGFESFGGFLTVVMLWIASGPIASLIFGIVILGERPDAIVAFGVVFIALGSFLVVAHREIGAFFH